jgi:hypothetical protein
MQEKFFLPCAILETRSYNEAIQDEIDRRRDQLIAGIESKMRQITKLTQLVSLKWRLI